MDTMTAPNLSEQIAQVKRDTQMAKEQLLRTFEFVPEDKLRWSPSPMARHALWIVGHCGIANQAFATSLRGEELPLNVSPEEASAQILAAGRDISSREEAIKLVKDSTTELLQALDNVTEEMLETSPMSPFGPFPFVFWMRLPAEHIKSHSFQIDYLQTIWGDLESH
jgi:hypothetical protein